MSGRVSTLVFFKTSKCSGQGETKCYRHGRRVGNLMVVRALVLDSARE
jgi:hypothetical protein